MIDKNNTEYLTFMLKIIQIYLRALPNINKQNSKIQFTPDTKKDFVKLINFLTK